MTVYVNGVADNGLRGGTIPSALNAPAAHVVLAKTADLAAPLTDGLDDVRIYDRVLTATEIERIYAGDF